MPKTLPAFLLLLLSLSLAGQQWDFRQSGSLLGFRPLNFISCEAVPGQGLRCVGHSNAYLFTPPELALRAEDYDYLVIDYQGDAPAFPIYFSRNGAPPSEETRLNGRPVPGRRQHIYPLLGHPQWKDTITLLRFDVVLTEGGQADVRRIRLVKELPVDLDGAQIPNGDFSQGSEGWEGDTASISPLQATLPPGATLLSPWGEVPYTGRYLLDAEFDGAPQATLECRDILGNPLESLEVSLPCTFTSAAMAAEVRVKFVNPTQEPVHLKRVSLLGIPADMSLETALQEFHNGRPLSSSQGNVPLFSGSWLWEESLVDLPQRTALFLREFVLEDPASLASAFLYLTADNEGEAALNGTPLPLPFRGNWKRSDAVSLLPLLKPGLNRLLVKVYNGDGDAGLLAEIHLEKKDGSRQRIVTDGQWRVCPLPAGQEGTWMDLTPGQAPLLQGKNGVSPWGPISYLPPITRELTLTGLDLPRSLPEGGTWTPAPVLKLQGQGTVGQSCDFSLRLQDGVHDFLAINTLIPAEALEGKDSLPLEVSPVHLELLPPGTYQAVATINQVPIPLEGNRTLVIPTAPEASQDLLPTARLVDTQGVPQLLIDGKERASLTQYLIDMEEGDNHYREIKHSADNGIPGLWLHLRLPLDQDGNPVFTNLDNICTSTLLRNPQVHLVIIAGLDPMRHPSMLPHLQKDPRTLVETADGSHAVRNYSEAKQVSPSLASPQWLAFGDRILRQIVEHVRTMPYGKRVVALLPSSGITWEWMYWGCQRDGEFVDYSLGFREAFVRFAQRKYGDVAKANLAWGTTFASYQEILDNREALPMPSRRMDLGNTDFLRIPSRTQMVMDFNRCMAEVVAEAIIHLCGTVKEASQGKLLSGAYYGYLNLITGGRWAQNSGHWAISKTLASPNVDLFHAPTTYNDRGPGGAAGFMVPDGSIRRAGKVFVTESDIRTLHSGAGRDLGGCLTLAESKAVLIREVAACLSHSVAMRYYDFSQGWVFKDPRLAQLAGRLSQAEQAVAAAKPSLDNPAQAMAIVISENAMEHIPYGSSVNTFALTHQYEELPRSGVAFTDYVIPDIRQIPLEHKFWFFQNPYKLSPQEVAHIQEKILVPGNTVLFALGADVVRRDGFSTETLEKLTGMAFRIDRGNASAPTAALTPEGEALLDHPLEKNYPHSLSLTPVFRPVDGGTVLARDEQGNPVLAQGEVNGCRVLFTALPRIPASWLRALAKQTGLHCYNDTPRDITWAAGNVMGFHFPKGGPRILHAPVPGGVARELLTGKEYPIQDGDFPYEAQEGSSALFLVQP